ncbi:uncharacterized protein OCT59_020017 [Rhizophagus irregularis]|uniref:uncharacterized protein n=1 Tax=Rhizophagus irregularis TaxID=588596 RepID=UPI003316E0D6|nr:hypothetical protein OCT59_020017 [Rhizophagus irregularis]
MTAPWARKHRGFALHRTHSRINFAESILIYTFIKTGITKIGVNQKGLFIQVFSCTRLVRSHARISSFQISCGVYLPKWLYQSPSSSVSRSPSYSILWSNLR